MNATALRRTSKTVRVRDGVETRIFKVEPAPHLAGQIKLSIEVLIGTDEEGAGSLVSFAEGNILYANGRIEFPSLTFHIFKQNPVDDSYIAMSLNTLETGIFKMTVEDHAFPRKALPVHRVTINAEWYDHEKVGLVGTKVY